MSSNVAMEEIAISIWLNMPSPHQEDLLRAIASREGTEVQVYYSRPLSESRASEGWSVTPQGYEHRTFSRRFDVLNVLRAVFRDRNRVHIFGGIWSTLNIALAITAARMLRVRYLILSESPDHPARPVTHSARHRIKQKLTNAARNGFGRWITGGSRGLLAISRFAEAWYANHGVDSSKIYPFGYFKAGPSGSGVDQTSMRQNLTLLYVGRQSYAKGLDLLLDALEPLWTANKNLRLKIIGKRVDDIQPGPHGLEAKEDGRLVIREALPFRDVEQEMRQSDVLILPSRGDGWGMVVVEALMNGLPVIVSDQCGVADIVHDGSNGFVFCSGDVDSLRHAIDQFSAIERTQSDLRESALSTGRLLDTDLVAGYLLACINHAVHGALEKPKAPWLSLVEAS